MTTPERTPDGRHVVIDGRRWRAADPAIPQPLRTQLVRELMAARRAVRAAGDDHVAERAARDRVHDAKVALGERGPAWWDEPSDDDVRVRLAAAIRALLHGRSEGSTICPSDAARAVGGERWRDRMPLAHEVVRELAGRGEVEVTQAAELVADAARVTGPIRVRFPAGG